jgi:hypothetical protein
MPAFGRKCSGYFLELARTWLLRASKPKYVDHVKGVWREIQ